MEGTIAAASAAFELAEMMIWPEAEVELPRSSDVELERESDVELGCEREGDVELTVDIKKALETEKMERAERPGRGTSA